MQLELHNLPPISPAQANVIGAMLAPHADIHQVAEQLDMQLAEFFDILASPEVQAHLTHIQRSLDQRLRLRLTDTARNAVDALDSIVQSPNPKVSTPHDPGESDWQTERRRAATTLLRAATARSRRRRIDHDETNDLNDKLTPRMPAPASPPPRRPEAPDATAPPTEPGTLTPQRLIPRHVPTDRAQPDETRRDARFHAQPLAPTARSP